MGGNANQEVSSKAIRFLFVDDEPAIREMCQRAATRAGYPHIVASRATEALAILAEQPMDVVFTDLRMPDMDGIALLREVKARYPEILVVVMTGYGTIETAVEAMRSGAYDYIVKPLQRDDLALAMERVAATAGLVTENRALREQVSGTFFGLVGRSRRMQEVFQAIVRLGPSNCPVLVQGETGTGKELVALALHQNSPPQRAQGRFVAVDCGALPENLIQSELFGYVRGAFTGADRSREGLLRKADGGTLFLDEIGDLPLEAQAKLLRSLQEKEVRPLGSDTSVPTDFRLIAATHHDLAAAVAQGAFRQDLYFRIDVGRISLPPLRERTEDIPPLVEYFLNLHGDPQQPVVGISEEALALLLAHSWPGNVRELENCVRRCLVTASPTNGRASGLIEAEDVRQALAASQPLPPSEKATRLSDLERNTILKTLEETAGDKSAAARRLGIGRATLYRKLSRFKES
jgi:DNA-binding NtrC family response regulator